jgi:hypothetical protein
MMRSRYQGIVLLLIILALLVGGALFLNSQRDASPFGTVPSPTATPSSSLSPIPTEGALSPTAKQTIRVYLVALEDNGKSGEKIGCGDSLVSVERQIPATSGVLKASLTDLFSLKEQYYGQSGLYNSLYHSDLKVAKVEIANGKATIFLSGQLSLGGVCDNPRVEGQIRATALQFSTVKSVDILLNGKILKDVLSEQ